jgi:hypothetical protein
LVAIAVCRRSEFAAAWINRDDTQPQREHGCRGIKAASDNLSHGNSPDLLRQWAGMARTEILSLVTRLGLYDKLQYIVSISRDGFISFYLPATQMMRSKVSPAGTQAGYL